LIGLVVGLAAMILTLIRYISGFIRESKKRQEALCQQPVKEENE